MLSKNGRQYAQDTGVDPDLLNVGKLVGTPAVVGGTAVRNAGGLKFCAESFGINYICVCEMHYRRDALLHEDFVSRRLTCNMFADLRILSTIFTHTVVFADYNRAVRSVPQKI